MRIGHAHTISAEVTMAHVYNRKAPKQAANLSVNRELLNAAREAGVNLSAVLEEALAEKVAQAKREHWVRENSDAIAEYNDFVDEHGVMSDGARSF
jgi:antitoxin CcdA